MPEHPTQQTGALRLAIDAGELGAALEMLRRLFDVRITFFDLDGVEAAGIDIKPISAYCRARRRDPLFDARCIACDRRNLDLAKRGRLVRVYRCHDGLVEGVVPLYDRAGAYLGSIMFGQMRPAGERRGADARCAALRKVLPAADPGLLRDLAKLLKWLTEHLVAQAVVRGAQRPWAEQAAAWIQGNLGRRLTIGGLARQLGRSESFVSHRFPKEFGLSLHRYVLQARVVEAQRRLGSGEGLAGIAASLGFCDASHLSRTCRSVLGATPRILRRQGGERLPMPRP